MILVKTPYLKEEDDSSPYSIFQSSFDSPKPQQPIKILSLINSGESSLRLQRSLSLNTTRRLKWVTLHFSGGNPKPKPTLGKPNSKSQQVHFHENDHSLDTPHPEDSTQAIS